MARLNKTIGTTGQEPEPDGTGIVQSDVAQLTANVQILAAMARKSSHNRGDLDLAALRMSDAAKLQMVLDSVVAGDLRRARIRMDRLETGARDEIPQRLYEAILRGGREE
ncbi:MAG: hypothetical protein KAY32_17140 [Candidatus Eisenbacteria sp.]|nr:hypothetical protein [Candidatus Eisenbacteria bacterium]